MPFLGKITLIASEECIESNAGPIEGKKFLEEEIVAEALNILQQLVTAVKILYVECLKKFSSNRILIVLFQFFLIQRKVKQTRNYRNIQFNFTMYSFSYNFVLENCMFDIEKYVRDTTNFCLKECNN